MSGDVWLSQLERAVLSASSGGEARDAAQPSAVHRTAPNRKLIIQPQMSIVSLLRSSGQSSCVTIKSRNKKTFSLIRRESLNPKQYLQVWMVEIKKD